MAKSATDNPIAKPLAITSTISLLTVGLSAVLGWDAILDVAAIPLLLACSALVLAYSAFALKLGEIGTVGRLGKIETYERSKQPFFFYLLLLLYASLSGMTTFYLSGRLLGIYH